MTHTRLCADHVTLTWDRVLIMWATHVLWFWSQCVKEWTAPWLSLHHRSPPVCCMQVWGVSPWMPSCSFLVSGVFLAGLEGFQEEAAPSSLANFSGTIMYNIDDLYDSTLLSCTRATKKVSWFWRCGQILPSLLSAYWVLSAYFLAVLEISVCAY